MALRGRVQKPKGRRATVRFRRILLVAAPSGEGPLLNPPALSLGGRNRSSCPEETLPVRSGYCAVG